VITHLRFEPKTPWKTRSRALLGLVERGVAELRPAFPGSDHPVRSAVYTIVLKRGADRAAVEDFIRETDCLRGITEEALGKIAAEPYPERLPAHQPLAG
jgi:hypothetical protein